MTAAVVLETVERELKPLLEHLSFGETMMLTGADGSPMALLVSLTPPPARPAAGDSWDSTWDMLARKISQAWQGEKSALQVLSEMRR